MNMRSRTEQRNYCDVLVIGAGPGGLSAAAAAAKELRRGGQTPGVLVLEREEIPGGILNQCVHDGFGIVRYGAQLSGPEYARIEQEKAEASGVRVLTGHMVTEIRRITEEIARFAVTAISPGGRQVFYAKAVVLATGCRERTRGMLSIPGTRPAGIFTAGVAQNLINRKNIMVGRRVVILGSGDIGLIMARRLSLEGAQVLCAAEVMEQPTGLARNVRQCLFDYDIPLYLRTGVSNIYGRDRLVAVELSQVDEHLQPIPGTGRRIECDTLILSVGLIPENEVAKTAGVALNRRGGAATDFYLQTSIPGIFACGNAREVMDLADFVSEQGEAAGRNAAAFAAGQPLRKWEKELHNAARRGMPEEGSVTCTLCPKGCQIRITKTDDAEQGEWSITGNGCPRGAAFARQERTDPQRILTTTMRIRQAEEAGGDRLIPVRSDAPVALREMKEIAEALREMTIALPAQGIAPGQVLVRDVGSTRVNIIAEAGMEGIRCNT
ncbi:MAG: FAD-dependent oxidoreductase [Firmicutes bacterium]|nr:FAD-dependent oxidoreductase [Bacillota bacterium]